MEKVAVVLFNLGGPDCPEAVEPFLFNLFNDRAIIGVPQPFRWLLAKLISRRRAPIARAIYQRIGGRSPLLPETEAQARALEAALGAGFRVFIAMRYWHPFTAEAVAEIKAWGAKRVILLPLYPQYSTTTTQSSLACWYREAARAGLIARVETICCYQVEPGMISGFAEGVTTALTEASKAGAVRVLFSAHGLPKKVVDRGDPYPGQVVQTAAAVATASGAGAWVVCYQSRVGPLEWIGPSLETELERAARDRVGVVVVPIAFVSEHSETLVELDIEYRHRAEALGVPNYIRVPAIGCHPSFIGGLADLVRQPGACRGLACIDAGRGRICREGS